MRAIIFLCLILVGCRTPIEYRLSWQNEHVKVSVAGTRKVEQIEVELVDDGR